MTTITDFTLWEKRHPKTGLVDRDTFLLERSADFTP